MEGGAGGVFKADGSGKSGNVPPFRPGRALSCGGADTGRQAQPSTRPAFSSRVREGPRRGQGGAKLWDVLQPEGMHAPCHGRFRIPIALWMLAELEPVQRET